MDSQRLTSHTQASVYRLELITWYFCGTHGNGVEMTYAFACLWASFQLTGLSCPSLKGEFIPHLIVCCLVIFWRFALFRKEMVVMAGVHVGKQSDRGAGRGGGSAVFGMHVLVEILFSIVFFFLGRKISNNKKNKRV